jgi:hypothetical protein
VIIYLTYSMGGHLVTISRLNGRAARLRPLIGCAVVLSLWPTAVYAQAASDQMARMCRRETAARLKIAEDDVIAQPSQTREQQEGPLLDWFTGSGARGQCKFQDGRLASWILSHKGRSFDAAAACAGEVAKKERLRPRDVDIVDEEKRSQTSSVLFWQTYQGYTGKCITRQNRIESVERD